MSPITIAANSRPRPEDPRGFGWKIAYPRSRSAPDPGTDRMVGGRTDRAAVHGDHEREGYDGAPRQREESLHLQTVGRRPASPAPARRSPTTCGPVRRARSSPAARSSPSTTIVRVVGGVRPVDHGRERVADRRSVSANGEKSPQPSGHAQVSRTSPAAVSTSNATVSSPRSPIANSRPGPRHSLQLTSTPAVSICRRAPEAGSTRRSWPATTYRSLQTASITATSRPSGDPCAHPSCTSLDVRTRSAPVVGSIATRGASYQAPSSVPCRR